MLINLFNFGLKEQNKTLPDESKTFFQKGVQSIKRAFFPTKILETKHETTFEKDSYIKRYWKPVTSCLLGISLLAALTKNFFGKIEPSITPSPLPETSTIHNVPSTPYVSLSTIFLGVITLGFIARFTVCRPMARFIKSGVINMVEDMRAEELAEVNKKKPIDGNKIDEINEKWDKSQKRLETICWGPGSKNWKKEKEIYGQYYIDCFWGLNACLGNTDEENYLFNRNIHKCKNQIKKSPTPTQHKQLKKFKLKKD